MKKILVTTGFLLLSKFGMSQALYTDSLLNCKTKMELTDIYLDQITKLAFATPYTSFTIAAKDSTKGLDMPSSKYIAKKRERILDISALYEQTMKEQLYELVPYSDKKDMIRAILFLQKTNISIK